MPVIYAIFLVRFRLQKPSLIIEGVFALDRIGEVRNVNPDDGNGSSETTECQPGIHPPVAIGEARTRVRESRRAGEVSTGGIGRSLSRLSTGGSIMTAQNGQHTPGALTLAKRSGY